MDKEGSPVRAGEEGPGSMRYADHWHGESLDINTTINPPHLTTEGYRLDLSVSVSVSEIAEAYIPT